MSDMNNIIVTGTNTKELLACINSIVKHLGGTLGKGFSESVSRYLVADFHNAHSHLNGRSVADILAEADNPDARPSGGVVAEGSRDGTRFTLYEAPNKRKNKVGGQG